MSPPLQFNPTTNEHFLRLPPPHENIILTPVRQTDGSSVIEIMNNPRVYQYLDGPPFPYTEATWADWFPIISGTTRKALEEYLAVEEARAKGEEGKWVGSGQPVSNIREVDAEGNEVYLGNISIRRSLFALVDDAAEKERVKALNDGLKAGDPEIQWEIGFFLSPAAHGRGIMPAALRTLIDSFYIPYMNVHALSGAFHESNGASRRVFEKVGFVFDRVVPDVMELAESKTGVKGKKVGLGVMRWKR